MRTHRRAFAGVPNCLFAALIGVALFGALLPARAQSVWVVNPQPGENVSTQLFQAVNGSLGLQRSSPYVINGIAFQADSVGITITGPGPTAVAASAPVSGGVWQYTWQTPLSSPPGVYSITATPTLGAAKGSPAMINVNLVTSVPAGSIAFDSGLASNGVYLGTANRQAGDPGGSSATSPFALGIRISANGAPGATISTVDGTGSGASSTSSEATATFNTDLLNVDDPAGNLGSINGVPQTFVLGNATGSLASGLNMLQLAIPGASGTFQRSVVVDSTPPSIDQSLQQPNNLYRFVGPDNILLTGMVHDPDNVTGISDYPGGIARVDISAMQFNQAGQINPAQVNARLQFGATPSSSVGWSANLNPPGEGVYGAYATARDLAGNYSLDATGGSNPFLIVVDSAAPTATINSVAGSAPQGGAVSGQVAGVVPIVFSATPQYDPALQTLVTATGATDFKQISTSA